MMHRNLLKNALRAKFEFTQMVISCLPENMQKPIKHFQHECMLSIQEGLESVIQDIRQQHEEQNTEERNRMKTITID